VQERVAERQGSFLLLTPSRLCLFFPRRFGFPFFFLLGAPRLAERSSRMLRKRYTGGAREACCVTAFGLQRAEETPPVPAQARVWTRFQTAVFGWLSGMNEVCWFPQQGSVGGEACRGRDAWE